LEIKVGWKKGRMMGDKNYESESDIPAGIIARSTAIISTRERKRYQQLIIGGQGRLGKMDNKGKATYQHI
jgi:hypothetical protein